MTFQNTVFHNQIHVLGSRQKAPYIFIYQSLIISLSLVVSISDLLRQEIWGVIYLKLLDNFHLSLPKTFLLLGIMAGQREKPQLVLRLSMDTDPSTCRSTEKTCWAVKLKHAANVRTCIFKPRLLQIITKKLNTLDLMFPDFTGNYCSYRGGMWKAT